MSISGPTAKYSSGTLRVHYCHSLAPRGCRTRTHLRRTLRRDGLYFRSLANEAILPSAFWVLYTTLIPYRASNSTLMVSECRDAAPVNTIIGVRCLFLRLVFTRPLMKEGANS